MSTAAYPSPHNVSASANLAPWARLLEEARLRILKLVQAHEASRKTRQAAMELHRLSDRELRDIGLTRAEIDAIGVNR